VASCSHISPHAYELCEETEFLSIITHSFAVDDILEKLNIIELFDEVCKSLQGVKYLEKTGTINKLLETIKNPEEDALVINKIIRFLGSVSSRGDIYFSTLFQAPFIDVICQILAGEENDTLEACIATIGGICSTDVGLRSILSNEKKKLLDAFLENIKASDTVLMVSTFYSLSAIFGRTTESCKNELHELFLKISQDPPTAQLLLDNFNSPFIELRYSVFAFITSVLKHSWGVKELLEYPGFLEFIMDRSTEKTKQGKEWKYAIAEQIVKQGSAPQVISAPKFQDLVTYLKLGVYFIDRHNVVMLEDKTG